MLLPKLLKSVLAGAVLVLGVSQLALAKGDWTVNAEQSSLAFVSVKKNSIGEVHKFTDLSGSLSSDGAFSLSIGLNSVDTGIEIRNQRMQEFLFQTEKFAQASISGVAADKQVSTLAVGKTLVTDLPFTLSLHGVEKSLTAKVQVVRVNKNTLLVSSLAPVVINAADFALIDGIQKLQELAGLPSIDTAVPVTLNLILTR